VSPFAEPRLAGIRRFRVKLTVAMMLVVSLLTSLGIYVAQRRAAEDAQADLRRDFELELASLHHLQDLRNAAVADRCKTLASNARIHAALEDNALDLLYPSARAELRNLMERADPAREDATDASRARFYRFLDKRGAVIAPPKGDAGNLLPNEEEQLAQDGVPTTMQTGYLARQDTAGRPTVDEMIAVPIRSTETNEAIAALVLGFTPVETIARSAATGMKSGILAGNKLHLPSFDRAASEQVARKVERIVAQADDKEHSLEAVIGGEPHLLLFKRLNLHSNYPPAYEVCIYPLTQLLARQRQLRWQFVGAGGLLLLGGFVVSHFFSQRLSQPVEKLAVVSEENRAQRQRAEAKLETTAEELQRSARFSADASHQLKSPITVLRAGLDSMLAHDGLPREIYEEIASLIHQTYRLTGVVEDLLTLSRMDAGALRLNLQAVNLTQLVEEQIEDLQAMSDGLGLRVETDVPANLQIAGEQKYTTLVIHNLLDNARKYNRPGGIIRVSAHEGSEQVELRVANTGRGIPSEAQPYVFERFHRAGASEDVAGHGLGLNLARELVRLHGGELRLVRSDAEWTEFGVRFTGARSASSGVPAMA
jgi:signal transduction histidine kinase